MDYIPYRLLIQDVDDFTNPSDIFTPYSIFIACESSIAIHKKNCTVFF